MNNKYSLFKEAIFVLGIVFFSLSCSKKENEVHESRVVDLPDDIPYEKLESGKLLFSRNNKFYLIDIDAEEVSEYNMNPVGPAILSPDGTMIAYSTLNDVLEIIHMDGTVYTKLSYPDQCFNLPGWSMDSKRIVYFDHCYSSTYNLFELPVVENCCTRSLVKTFNQNSYLINSPFSVSAEGNIVFFAESLDKEQDLPWDGLYIMNNTGENLKSIITVDDTAHYNLFCCPKWSPDSKKIAYISLNSLNSIPPEYQDIMLINPDGTDPQSLVRIEFAPGIISGMTLCWSPDGSKIAFTRMAGEGLSNIYMVDVSSGKLTQITDEPRVTDAYISWSE